MLSTLTILGKNLTVNLPGFTTAYYVNEKDKTIYFAVRYEGETPREAFARIESEHGGKPWTRIPSSVIGDGLGYGGAPRERYETKPIVPIRYEISDGNIRFTLPEEVEETLLNAAALENRVNSILDDLQI